MIAADRIRSAAMASIRKRSWTTVHGEIRERWQVDFVDQAGKRRHKQFDRKKDADAFLVQARAQVQVGIYTPESTSVTIGEAIDLWIGRAAAEGLEYGTQQQYRQHRRHLLEVIDGRIRLARLTQARCEQLRDDLLKAHRRPMAQKVLQSFKSVIRDARRRGLIAQNVAADTTIGTSGRHRRRLEVGVDVPTPGEIKTLIEAADPKARALICLAALAGLRASEFRGLRWANLDLGSKPSVTISERADYRSIIGSPKSASSRRTVPLSEMAVRALKEWRLAQPPGRSLVFGTARDRPDMLSNLQRRLLTPLETKAGVRRYSWHAFRHYAVSAWLATGIDPKTVQHWAGHATLTLTIDRYGHMIPRLDDHERIAAAERSLLG
jgi:integrase